MGANVTIDAACTPKTFETSVNVTSPAGRVVVMGFDDVPHRYHNLLLQKGNLQFAVRDFRLISFPKL